MTLTIETGAIVANANSYADLTTIKSYASKRGICLLTDTDIEQKAILAMDYLESKRDLYKGTKVSSSQSLQFPRYNVDIDGFDISSTTIPTCLINAQCQLIIEQQKGFEIFTSQSEFPIKKETIGPITTEYAISNNSILNPEFPAVDVLLKPILKTTSSSGFALTTVRI